MLSTLPPNDTTVLIYFPWLSRSYENFTKVINYEENFVHKNKWEPMIYINNYHFLVVNLPPMMMY